MLTITTTPVVVPTIAEVAVLATWAVSEVWLEAGFGVGTVVVLELQ